MGRKRVSFKITFYLRRTRVTKAGLAPILSRITVNGVAAEIPVKCHIRPERWDQAKERASGKDKLSVEVNAYLDNYHRARVLEIRRPIEQEGREVSVFGIKERLTHATRIPHVSATRPLRSTPIHRTPCMPRSSAKQLCPPCGHLKRLISQFVQPLPDTAFVCPIQQSSLLPVQFGIGFFQHSRTVGDTAAA